MARYEYRCSSCGSMSMLEQSILLPTPEEEIRCVCGKTRRRVYTSISVILSGGGWTPKYHGNFKEKKGIDI